MRKLMNSKKRFIALILAMVLLAAIPLMTASAIGENYKDIEFDDDLIILEGEKHTHNLYKYWISYPNSGPKYCAKEIEECNFGMGCSYYKEYNKISHAVVNGVCLNNCGYRPG